MSPVDGTVNGNVHKIAGGLTLPACGMNQPEPVQTMDGNASSPATASDGTPAKTATAQEVNEQATANPAKENKSPAATAQQKFPQQAPTNSRQDATTAQVVEDTHHTQQSLTATAPSQSQYPAQYLTNGQNNNVQDNLHAQQKTYSTAQAAITQADDEDFTSPLTNEYIAQRAAAGFLSNYAAEMIQAHAAIDQQALPDQGCANFNLDDMDFSDVAFDDNDMALAEMNQMLNQDPVDLSFANPAQHGQGNWSGQHQQGNPMSNVFPHQQYDSQGNATGNAYHSSEQFNMARDPAMHQHQQYGHPGNPFVSQSQMYQGNRLPNYAMPKQVDDQANTAGNNFAPQPAQQVQRPMNMIPSSMGQQHNHPDTLPSASMQQQPRINGRLKAVRSKPRPPQSQGPIRTTESRGKRSQKQASQGTMQHAQQGQRVDRSVPTQLPMNMMQHHNTSQPLSSQLHHVPTQSLQMPQPIRAIPLVSQQVMQPATSGLAPQQQVMRPVATSNQQMARTAPTKPKGQRMSEEDLINRANAMTGPELGNTAGAMASSGN
ncbi:hypothetical protein DL546_003364 [Coniochaeta pulveracea]|uniref:Uncharacterized protein n=1 Tax=Coniochaeta pulveracea TaxID=177199 RepID=A0A420Y865_9PEZI|nr:hypothetical protein DL546_003364 [Coniochaeta pulveracea]